MYYDTKNNRRLASLPTQIGTIKNPTPQTCREHGIVPFEEVREQVEAAEAAQNTAQQEAERQRIADNIESMAPSVMALQGVLMQFGLSLPITYDDALADIEARVASLTPEQTALIGTLKVIHAIARERCGGPEAVLLAYEIIQEAT